MSAQSYSEDAVKAAYLYRFAAYVQWPQGNAANFTVAVAGADGVAEQLEKLLNGRQIQGRPARVVRVHRAQELQDAQILYVAPPSPARRTLLEAASGQPILAVTDEEGGLAAGAVINFLPVGRNVRFEVSLPAAERQRLKLNAGLLSVAARVERSPQALLCASLPQGALAACNNWPTLLLASGEQPRSLLYRRRRSNACA
ncbi:MAG: YfiR family protein [Gammaproteobacteria bacterium]|nr:YfiR family protein [Gammaproteobacteria bacterium]